MNEESEDLSASVPEGFREPRTAEPRTSNLERRRARWGRFWDEQVAESPVMKYPWLLPGMSLLFLAVALGATAEGMAVVLVSVTVLGSLVVIAAALWRIAGKK